ncbi:HAD family hydrolase, partial [Enterococcus faecalis]
FQDFFINLIEAIAVSFVEILLLEFLNQLTVLNFLIQSLRLQ